MLKPVAWMVAASGLSWLAAAAVASRENGLAIFFGMIGPLVVTTATGVMAERIYRRDPARLTSFMIAAFAGKMVFFGVYVAVMLKGLSVRPMPFVLSLTAYFVALHLWEALALRCRFSGGVGASE
jgi:hypothetical protein